MKDKVTLQIDSFFKNDEFPLPESNTILVADGFGFQYEAAKTFLPANLLNCCLPFIGEVSFKPYFTNGKTHTALLFQLPKALNVKYDEKNKVWQEIYDGTTKLFDVCYWRDYDNIEINTCSLISMLKKKYRVEIPKIKYRDSTMQSFCRYTEDQEYVAYEDLVIPESLITSTHLAMGHALLDFFSQFATI